MHADGHDPAREGDQPEDDDQGAGEGRHRVAAMPGTAARARSHPPSPAISSMAGKVPRPKASMTSSPGKAPPLPAAWAAKA